MKDFINRLLTMRGEEKDKNLYMTACLIHLAIAHLFIQHYVDRHSISSLWSFVATLPAVAFFFFAAMLEKERIRRHGHGGKMRGRTKDIVDKQRAASAESGITTSREQLSMMLAKMVMEWHLDGRVWVDSNGRFTGFGLGNTHHSEKWKPTECPSQCVLMINMMAIKGYAWNMFGPVIERGFPGMEYTDIKNVQCTITKGHTRVNVRGRDFSVTACLAIIEAITGNKYII